MRVALIVNPISGTGGRRDVARRRAEMAAAFIEERRLDGEVFVTERPRHAYELAKAAVGRGVELVVAWGGDGTMNEVGSAVAFTPARMAIVPSGSGNGLARELGIPLDPAAALSTAVDGADRRIDAGEIEGHLFFNVAGIGLDANVAHRFAANGLVRRGFTRYITMTLRELFTYEPQTYTVVTDSGSAQHIPLMIAIANGRQYGNGAIIAPGARLDDGRLDVVTIAHRPTFEALVEIPSIFAGRVTSVRGVSTQTSRCVEISAREPIVFHADGEPYLGGRSVRAFARPDALTVKVPSKS